MTLRIAFHGSNALCFIDDFAALLKNSHEISVLPDRLDLPSDRIAYEAADVIIAGSYSDSTGDPRNLKLFLVPGAGYDAVNLKLMPVGATVCNCFGHEQAIAEYVFAALLRQTVPLSDGDSKLRQGEWAYNSSSIAKVHGEVAGRTIGLLGFGHIGKAIAARAKAFEMRVIVANRSRVETGAVVDESFHLDRLPEFFGSADYLVVSLPLTPETTSIVGEAAFAAMQPHAIVINVGRGATIDEKAFYEALAGGHIGGAIIDTWYRYPNAENPVTLPSAYPFHELTNVLMTPHMSGWTTGTVRRRQKTMAENINRLVEGKPLMNIIREGRKS